MSQTNGVAAKLAAEIAIAGGERPIDPLAVGAVGRTLFDLPGSTDLGVTVLLPDDQLHEVPSQAIVRIKCRGGKRTYLGVVAAGPFAEPDGLRGDSAMLQAVATRGGDYLPPYHGRVQVTILGEELAGGAMTPPRYRPLPNSPVFALSDPDSVEVLKCDGDIRLGLAGGHERVVVGVPSDSKSVLPRHLAVLGTTGGGKSNTVAGLVKHAVDSGMAVVLLDVEGEYTRLHEPTHDEHMTASLRDRGLEPAGVPVEQMAVYHLAGRGTSNPAHPNLRPFRPQFCQISPYQLFEILDLSDAQQERFFAAYEITKVLMRELGVFPVKNDDRQERLAAEVDEFERGWPRMTLGMLIDVVTACLERAKSSGAAAKKSKKEDDGDDEPVARPKSPEFANDQAVAQLKTRLNSANPPGNWISWAGLLGRLSRLYRLRVYYEGGSDKTLVYPEFLKPGRLSVVDLSDSGYPELNNLVIADLLAGVMKAQDDAYARFEKSGGAKPPRVLVVIEEAHEFLSEDRISRTPVLFQQVARIAKRGRKRWLGLCFVTQLPAHLPKQVLGLCNSFLLHKLTDPYVVNALKRAVGGVDDGLWDRLPNLAPGQAIAAFPHFTRPVLMSVDPAPCRLRMTE